MLNYALTIKSHVAKTNCIMTVWWQHSQEDLTLARLKIWLGLFLGYFREYASSGGSPCQQVKPLLVTLKFRQYLAQRKTYFQKELKGLRSIIEEWESLDVCFLGFFFLSLFWNHLACISSSHNVDELRLPLIHDETFTAEILRGWAHHHSKANTMDGMYG